MSVTSLDHAVQTDDDTTRFRSFRSDQADDCIVATKGERYFTLARERDGHTLAAAFADSGMPSVDDYLGTVCTGVAQSAQTALCDRQENRAPFLPATTTAASVFSFGYTHAEINGKPVERGNVDFYYKGSGALLRVDGEPLVPAMRLVGGGFEVEYCAVYAISGSGRPKYIGYCLASDFSDVGLRKRHKNLAGLSKLQPSVVSAELIADELPLAGHVDAQIIRDGEVLWTRSGTLGTAAMMYSRRTLERLLFANEGACQPHTVVYVLLGSCLSSYKDGVVLREGDRIEIMDHTTGLTITNTLSSSI